MAEDTEKKEAVAEMTSSPKSFMDQYGIWVYAFGYFAAYWPYSAITKIVTDRNIRDLATLPEWLKGVAAGLPGPEVLPLSVFASVIGALLFLHFRGLFKYAPVHKKIGNFEIPLPDKNTFISGLCSSIIIATTTLAYTFTGVSVIFIMLIMRGGLLILGPVIDKLNKRTIRWFSFVAMILSVLSLIVTFLMKQSGTGESFDIMKAFGPEPGACITNVLVYLAAYFFRLNLMSSKAKSKDPDTNTRYFVGEQLTSSPSLFIMVMAVAIANVPGWTFSNQLHDGITHVFTGYNFWWVIFLIGVFSAGNGIFGGLILLDKSENTFSIPVNRCSSIIAGLLATATVSLMTRGNLSSIKSEEIIGAAIIIFAIVFLTVPTLLEKNKKKTDETKAEEAK
ncbi:MAG: hypothetical protein MJ234_05590 [bacterium]|nr:hypothetical protein [bacterium]